VNKTEKKRVPEQKPSSGARREISGKFRQKGEPYDGTGRDR
jgi:hypothetical protein